eukprot:9692928-Alexandrium_andersonii.AAC.1
MPRRTAVAPREATSASATTPARSATRAGAVLGPTGPCATTHGVAPKRVGQSTAPRRSAGPVTMTRSGGVA